jgi:hypothetical protein
MTSVYSNPFSGFHTGGKKDPETEEVLHRRVQIESTMCRKTMKVDRNSKNRDLHHYNGVNHLDPRKVSKEAVKKKRSHITSYGLKCTF